jgi:DNA-binding transcriptional ArsR family regulator
MDVFDALADPTRREIVALLAQGERLAGDIATRFPVSGPAISRHLRVLRESQVVSFRQDGQARVYRLEPEGLRHAERWMAAQLARLEARFGALGAHLETMKKREEDDGAG